MHVTLVMIVKNEERVIKRALESVREKVHSWVIHDTGSTDRTVDIVKETMAGIPGHIRIREWKNFSWNRNLVFRDAEAFQKTAALSVDEPYLFMLDADDLVSFHKDFEWPKCDLAAGYRVRVQHNGVDQDRVHLFRSGLGWEHVRRVHEYSRIPDHDPIKHPLSFLNGATYVSGSGGARAEDPGRWIRDAALLEEDLKETPNDPRTLFYLARSYKYAGNLELASDFFERRIAADGWIEEKFYAAYELLECTIALKRSKEECIRRALEAFTILPTRAEPLWRIARHLRMSTADASGAKEAFPFASAAASIPKPDQGLFVHRSVYEWQSLDELAVSAYWCGNRKLAQESNLKILERHIPMPVEDANRILANLALTP